VIEDRIVAARHLLVDGPGFLALPYGLQTGRLESGFAHDHSRTLVGHGEDAFAAAKRTFERWAMFDLGWVRVANPQALIAPGHIVAVEARTLGLWSLNLSRIANVVETGNLFGFIYATTQIHVEQGEERFLIEFDTTTGDVWYEIEAVSRPRDAFARLGFPLARAFQHRFVRDSHRRMGEEVLAECPIS
jgi:uncharacterized protein (UPF0548 family)